ncbi:HNH endonuclease [Corynebacterium sp. p3-SID1145]|uniref:HNH endonuclease signature motif containing protein n=1 Tax=unclassified Corynebacterium TaxID=2624378 RepID=UPI0021AA62BB|nr:MULTISPECIES: HNH endonuclease signature motif containing protein [unclassified Corynebacterium]MCT1453011.1 HNH endonuclease [Corynebacterium sp. p3-SID1145]MCT1462047.1 HNH endonuclease [Corynebacterium sp. p3-SID1140]
MEPFFETENPDDTDAILGMALRKSHHAVFRHYAEDGFCGSHDHDLEMARMRTATGIPVNEVKAAVYAYMTLGSLPRLKQLQEETARLDLSRLKAIDRAVGMLGHDIDQSIHDIIDDMLVDLFTPDKPHQELPSAHRVTSRLHKLIGSIDSSVAHDKRKRKARESAAPGQYDLAFHDGIAHGTSGMTLSGDHTSMAAIKEFIREASKEHEITEVEAVVQLLTGAITPPANVTIFAYAPLDADGVLDESASAFIPGYGHTTAAGTEMVHGMGTTVVDIRPAKEHTVAGYVPPPSVRAYVQGRDGTCIYPGCDQPAWNCQLDHRIPYEEGGQTAAANLFSLCQHHHNCKTDRRAFYVPDPVTGDIVWLFADGTYALVDPDGIFARHTTPTAPRWKCTLDDIQRLKRDREQFFAKGHAILDAYDIDGDYEACVAGLIDLEREFRLDFPFFPEVK